MSLSEEGLTHGFAGDGTDGSMEMSSSSNGGDHGSGSISATGAGGAAKLLNPEILLAVVARESNCLSALARAVAHLWRHFITSGDLEEVVTLGGARFAMWVVEPMD